MIIGLSYHGLFGAYRLEAKLGEGAFGQVFRALGPGGRALAVKVLEEPLDLDAQQRFQGEQAILQPLRHRNIIDLLDRGVGTDGRPWYAMPLMTGGTLADVIARQRSWDDVLRLVGDAAKGLAAFHAVRGIHRDIKPENILVDEAGVAKIADFGLARCEVFSRKSITRSAAGTPPYMAPEVWRNEACEASDVYALGIVFWELVNGERHEVPARPPRLQDFGPDYKPLNELYRKMTAEDPTERPTAQEVATLCDRMMAWLARGQEKDGSGSAGPLVTGLAIVGGAAVAVGVGVAIGSLLGSLFGDDD